MRINFNDENEFYPSSKFRTNLLKHYSKHLHYIADYLARNCKDFQYLLDKLDEVYPRGFISKDLKGYVVGFLLARYTIYLHKPQVFGFRPEIVFMTNWFTLIQHLIKVVYALRYKKGAEIPRLSFHIPKRKLYKISKYFAQELMPICEEKIYPKYLRMMDEEYQKLSPVEKRIAGRWGKDSIKKKK